ncbi:hypothetical protein M3Y97_00032200 [Aphelenchoides bicaudatus]|nr:hypothetical protein M3Y97_00032200 [Aphelenchoides bicaudatus]
MKRNPSSFGSVSGQPLWYPIRRKWTLFLVALCLMLILGFQLADDQDVVDLNHYSYIFDSNSSESENCQIPMLDPWDETVRKYIENAPPIECRQIQAPLTYLQNRQLFFNLTAFEQAGYSLDTIQCQCRCFDRGRNDDTNEYEEWKNLVNGTQINCEFVEVDCRGHLSPLSVYNEMHAQLIPRQENSTKLERFSVSLFVLDSVSQSHWRRGLSKTLKVLEQNYNATVMTGFNKVADNSFPNAVAFLLGSRNPGDHLPAEPVDIDFNKMQLVWKDFKNQSYSTFYAEDYPDFNLFNYLSTGFAEKPVDHHFRPFWLDVYKSFVRRRSKYLCYNDKPNHLIQMAYYRELVQRYHGKRPFFALHWLTELAHDWLSQVSSADEDIEKMLLEEEERLQDTFLFMFSDHGHRFDPIRQTMIGRLEERMPFFSIHVPQKLRKRYPELADVLNWNSKQLASFFDLYITLQDILDLQQRNAWDELRQKKQPLERFRKLSAYGLSFLRPLPADRSCEQAGIPEEYCICQTDKPIDVNEPLVQRAASELVKHTNKLLEPYHDKCATLKLKQINGARVSAPNQKVMAGRRATRSRFLPMLEYGSGTSRGVYVNYALMIEVQPNGALLEATARHYFNDDSIQIVSDINRINKYGNQSVCVKDAIARKYCYCT